MKLPLSTTALDDIIEISINLFSKVDSVDSVEFERIQKFVQAILEHVEDNGTVINSFCEKLDVSYMFMVWNDNISEFNINYTVEVIDGKLAITHVVLRNKTTTM